MKVLVLGHKGMLGSVVTKYFTQQGFEVKTVESRYPSQEFKREVLAFDKGFIINCIGAIPQRTQHFQINTDLPIWLSNNTKCRVVHPGTDCETDTNTYGTSKRLASEYLKAYSTNTKILKSSIIGPEQGTSYSLMEWFLAQQGEAKGYTKALWNGNTTLEWAKQASSLIANWEEYNRETILEGESISKYEILCLLKDLYKKEINIIPVELGEDKCLTGGIKTPPLREQLEELKTFMYLNYLENESISQ